WCAGAFTFIGKGTPAPIDAPKLLVIQGPYQWVRNPMYVAVLSTVLGEAILFHSLPLSGYALLFWITCHLFVTFVEEPSLRYQFGASYETYLRTVPRWIPRLPQP
ncbi:MAG: isoprenylcysteine carboxylmethyltransferase family protein, partial [Ktedonobacteraceae bacterium]|nr:isoprenylcysteine carboxylmethyltransferase family protein [Ktedonobacteraceae bacterium]